MENILTYNKPADFHDNYMPIGNGRLGAMIKGGAGRGSILRDEICLNEDTLWHGKYQDRNNPDARKNIDRIRQLLRENKLNEAEDLARTAMSSTPKYFGAYEPLGTLYIEEHNGGKITDYKRSLNIGNAVAEVKYKLDGIQVKRRYFASHIDNSIIILIEADKNILSFSCNLMRRPMGETTGKTDENTVFMSSSCGENGVHFSCLMRGYSDGKTKVTGDYLCFDNCSYAIIKIAAHSDFYGDEPIKKCLETLKNTEKFNSEELLSRHINEYKQYYNRLKIDLGGEQSPLTADERLKAVKEGKKDRGLIELYFNFGRYLLISSSYPGTEAMNLQGIWNNSFTPAWECNYTININTEMNYWPAEICSLPEFTEPLFNLIYKMLPHGRQTAEKIYGCKGFVAHHCTNIWGDTAVEGNFFPSPIWPMGGAWLSLHLMEHYNFTCDTEFLRDKAYPVLKECAEFFRDYMVYDSEGYLVTGPSVSPENIYITPDGTEGSLCMGPYMDMEIVTELYKAVIKCCEILNKDRDFAEKLEKDLKHIRPVRINSKGGLMEWQEDYKEKEPGHRHMSHLFALCPGTEITYKTPELMDACRKTIESRLENGGGHTGWSSAWILNFYARLHEGEKCLSQIYSLLTKSTYESLLDVHPPFQIDGNMGAAAGIAEMLLQSHAGCIELLPALPEDFQNGYIEGIKARGGFTLNIYWEKGRLKKADIYSASGNPALIRLPSLYNVIINGENKKSVSEFTLNTEKDTVTQLIFT